jgi:hypothetical protein
MDAFERKVGRDQRFVPRWQTKHSAVIPDPGDDPSPRARSATNAGNKRFLG